MTSDHVGESEFLEASDYFEHARYSDALPIFSSLVTRFPENGLFHFAHGWTLYQLGEQGKACEAVESAARLSLSLPKNPYLIIADWLSLDPMNAVRIPWAEKAMSWAIESKNPFHIARARYNTALSENDMLSARQHLEEASLHAPDDEDTLANLSGVLLELKLYREAREVIESAGKRGVVSFTLLYALGNAIAAMSKEKEAMAVYEEAVYREDAIKMKATPKFQWLAHLLSRYYFRKGRFRDLMKLTARQFDLNEELKAQRTKVLT